MGRLLTVIRTDNTDRVQSQTLI